MQDRLVFNGIDAATGGYLTPPVAPRDLPFAVAAEVATPDHAAELRWRHRWFSESSFAPIEGIDPTDLSSTGWAVMYAAPRNEAIHEALVELLDHRRRQATAVAPRYQELEYRPGETKQQLLARLRAAPGPADPDRVPYYLLLVGGPEEIPYSVQYQLDVQYAVGRIHFDRVEDYATYARGVVAAELAPPRTGGAVFFATRNPGDRATALSSQQLAAPLAERFSAMGSGHAVSTVIGEAATKSALDGVVSAMPSLLFTASHGIGFPCGDPHQRDGQGALLCQDWPGPERSGPVADDWMFSASDLDSVVDLRGLISFHFACYSGGTPQWDDYSHRAGGERARLTDAPFVAALPRRMLSNPGGSALAAVGHVDRAWGYSFDWPDAGRQTAVYESCFQRLVNGHPIGSALEYFNERYAELSADLTTELEDVKFSKEPDDLLLASMWTANNDARGFALFGDPAVRLVRPVTSAASAPSPPTVVVAPIPEAPAPAPAPATPPPVDYGLLDSVRSARDRLAAALEGITDALADALGRAVENVTVIEVKTWVADDVDAVSYDRESRRYTGARLRASSRIEIDGDAAVLLPAQHDEQDAKLWELHLKMVEQARTARMELIKSAASALSGLLAELKGP